MHPLRPEGTVVHVVAEGEMIAVVATTKVAPVVHVVALVQSVFALNSIRKSLVFVA
jgi:hypothetical protein